MGNTVDVQSIPRLKGWSDKKEVELLATQEWPSIVATLNHLRMGGELKPEDFFPEEGPTTKVSEKYSIAFRRRYLLSRVLEVR